MNKHNVMLTDFWSWRPTSRRLAQLNNKYTCGKGQGTQKRGASRERKARESISRPAVNHVLKGVQFVLLKFLRSLKGTPSHKSLTKHPPVSFPH